VTGVLRRFWWAPVVVVVLALVLLNGARRDDEGRIVGSGSLPVSELRIGDCFDADQHGNIAAVDAVPCEQPHRFELYHVAEWPGDEEGFPSDVELEAFVFDSCLPALEAYIGQPVEGSHLFFSPIVPDQASWEAGRRVVYCALFDLMGEPLRGSQRAD
jgi:hypothetical protein